MAAVTATCASASHPLMHLRSASRLQGSTIHAASLDARLCSFATQVRILNVIVDTVCLHDVCTVLFTTGAALVRRSKHPGMLRGRALAMRAAGLAD